MRICPWCLRVRAPDGAMLPVGHYLPSGSGLTVEHAVCNACEARRVPV